MSAQDLKVNGTHISKLKGRVVCARTHPANTDVAGLAAGDMYYNTEQKSFYIYSTSSTWLGLRTTAV